MTAIVILFFFFSRKVYFVCLNIYVFLPPNCLSREKVNFGTAKVQSTTNGFLKEFKLAFNVAKTMITSIALNISFLN